MEKKLGKKLAKLAKKDGICNEWYARLKNTVDKKDMLQMYLDGIDFCLSNDYPDNEVIKEHFKGEMEEFGIFLDDHIDIANFDKVVCLGKTKGHVSVEGYGVTELFLKHDADIELHAKGNSFVEVDIFDDACVTVHIEDNAKVHINRYGGVIFNGALPSSAQLKITEKHKTTY